MERQESKNDELIPGLPDDCAMQCLARVSRKCMPSVKGVCRRWRDMLVDKNSLFYKLRLCQNLEHNEGARSSSKSKGREKDQSVVLSRYESQKRRDWHTFGHYLVSHSPPLALNICSGEHVVEYLRSLDQFGKTKIHNPACPFFGNPHPPASCPCPMKQAWGSLDALVGRLRGAYDASVGKPESNPFGAPNVRLYLREVRQMQATARGVSYKKRKSPTNAQLEQPQQQQEQVQMLQNQPHHCQNQVHVSTGNL